MPAIVQLNHYEKLQKLKTPGGKPDINTQLVLHEKTNTATPNRVAAVIYKGS
jgi:hypothetical protein